MSRSTAPAASFVAATVGLAIGLGLFASPAAARPRHAPLPTACCRIPVGTPVEVALIAPVGARDHKAGDTFALTLAAPLIVHGWIVLPQGAPGVGAVIESAKPGLGGKSGKLVLAARYIQAGRQRVPLEGLQLTGVGRDNSMVANVAGIGGIAFAPLGVVGLALPGGNVTLPAGAHATASVSADVVLRPRGRASRKAMALAAASVGDPADTGPIAIAPPPAGKGQVVFFRGKSLLGTGQWFKIREAGNALGKLTNGAYFVQITDPGVHSYTAKSEPEMKDRLRLEVAPGETYYVEGTLTKGVVIGVADLVPSTRSRFETVVKDLKPAETGDDKPAEPATREAAPTAPPAAENPPAPKS